jgi:hypothetical protein
MSVVHPLLTIGQSGARVPSSLSHWNHPAPASGKLLILKGSVPSYLIFGPVGTG